MKPLKTLVLAACLVGAVTSFAGAKDVKTIAGSMSVPNTVTVATASTTDSVDIIKDLLIKDNAKPTTNKRTRQSNEDALSALNYMGVSYDVYQLQGEDKTGQKDALLVAVDLKTAANALFDKAILNNGELDPITEQLMLTTVNNLLPKESKTFTLPDKNVPGSIYVSAGKDYSTAVGIVGESKNPTTITVENTEQMEKMNNTKYQTYTVGSRVLVDAEGIKFPYYAKAALVMNPQKPTLFLALTSDVQRQYFMPIFADAFKSIK
ncbi:MAG: hypothetical protein E7I83_05825 [Veillonella sp.]|nr:hypothetical protein [Veillonella sp.]